MQLNPLDRRILPLWYAKAALLWIVILAGCVVPAALIQSAPLTIALTALLAILTVFTFLYPTLAYRAYSFGYDEKRIVIKSGVVFRHSVTVPVRQIQDLHLYQGPVMTLFGVQGLILSTAGSNFSLAGLKKQDAEALVETFENLLEQRLDDEEIR